MEEQHADRVHPESIVLDIGGDIGALIIYTKPNLRGVEIEVSPVASPDQRTHVEVLERLVNDQTVYAAAFPELKAGEYFVWSETGQPSEKVNLTGGRVTSLDRREE